MPSPLVGRLLAAIDRSLSPFAFVGVYNFEHGGNWLKFIEGKCMANYKSKYGGKDYKNLFGKEIDEKMMKVLSITKRLAKAPQEYQKFKTDISIESGC